MAVTVTDNRTIRDEADATTNWTAAGTSTTVASGTASPTPREAGAHNVTTATSTTPAYQWLWHTGTSLGTGPHLIYIWMLTTATIGTRANGGLMLLIGDGTNRVGYHVGGDDAAPFRTDKNALVGYMCFTIDTGQLASWPYGATVQAGSRATLESNLNAITQIGTGCQVLAKAVGGAVNYWNDIIRYGVATDIATSGLTISGGTSGDPGKFTQIEAEDRAITDKKAHGIIRELAAGTFGVQGTLRFGDQATGSSWFEEANVVMVFEARDFATTRYKIVITDNGTGTTTFILTNCSLIAPTGVGASFDSLTDTNVTAVTVTGTRIDGFTQGIGVGGGVGQVFTNCVFSNGGAVSVTSQPVNLSNSSVTGSTVVADASSLVWNVTTDPDGYLDDMTFSKGTNAHHAITLGSNTPSSIALRGWTVSGFSSADGNNDSVIYNNSGKAITVNVFDNSGTISFKNGAGASTTIVTGVRTVKVAVTSTSGAVAGANVFLAAASGGPFPYQASVTSITRSGTTATVTHATVHGMATNDQVNISGITDKIEDNGVHTITYINTTQYSYTTTDSGSTNYTGTKIATFVFLKGTASSGTGSNEISMNRSIPSDQPVIGWARKSTSAPYYKEGAISGTVSSSGDTTFSPVLISDD